MTISIFFLPSNYLDTAPRSKSNLIFLHICGLKNMKSKENQTWDNRSRKNTCTGHFSKFLYSAGLWKQLSRLSSFHEHFFLGTEWWLQWLFAALKCTLAAVYFLLVQIKRAGVGCLFKNYWCNIMVVLPMSTTSLNKEKVFFAWESIFLLSVFYCVFPSMHFLHVSRTLECAFDSSVDLTLVV